MKYLYAAKGDGPLKLVATFGSEQQLLAYVNWATLKDLGNQTGKFEQGSVLAGYTRWEQSAEPPADAATNEVAHNPSPNML